MIRDRRPLPFGSPFVHASIKLSCVAALGAGVTQFVTQNAYLIRPKSTQRSELFYISYNATISCLYFCTVEAVTGVPDH